VGLYLRLCNTKEMEENRCNQFWNIIENHVREGETGQGIDYSLLALSLVEDDGSRASDFEQCLRYYLRVSYCHNVLGILRALMGYVSDDVFLNYRCALILAGRDLFMQSVNDPMQLDRFVLPCVESEEILSVSEMAYQIMRKQHSDASNPRLDWSDFYDYNLPDYDLDGEEWRGTEKLENLRARIKSSLNL